MPFSSVRKAQLMDIPQLLQIEEICFISDRINRRQFRYLLNRAKAVVQVIESGDGANIAGYGVCFIPGRRKTARLYSLAVLPEFRGNGFAGRLLTALLGQLRDRGFHFCNLEVRKADNIVQNLYIKHGFKAVAEITGYYEDGADAIRMRKEL